MLQVDHIVKRYGNHIAVNDLSFTVEKGQVLGFLGRNGAGKSTTMNIIAGYIAPTSGRALWNGKDINAETSFKAGLGYLPEVPPLYPDLTVREMLEYVCGLKKIRANARKKHINEVCELAHVEDYMNKQIRRLSKGYRQRTGLALALIGNPTLLVLDEPTAGLDPEQTAGLRAVIRELGKERAILLSSHVLSEVEDVCNRFVILRSGCKVAEGTMAEIAQMVRRDERRLRIRTAGSSAGKALETLPGLIALQKVETREMGFEEYILTSQQDLTAAVVDALHRAGAQLRMLYPMDVELEDVFLRLTEEEKQDV